MLNYEDELEEVLLDALKKKFCINDENKLLSYVAYRYFLVKEKKVDRHIMDFIFYELNCSFYVYKNIAFANDISTSVNNLNHIYENWNSYMELDPIICKKYTDYAKSKAKKWKDTDFFLSYRLYFALEILNKDFNTQNNYVEVIDLKQKSKMHWCSLEDNIEKVLHIEDNTTAFITENNLEDYLVTHLDLIEDGLKFVSRQFILPEGRLDILARDKFGSLVIIELKIEDDKKVVWQSVYYKLEMKKKFPNDNIRVITVLKDYPSYLLEPLLEVNVEPYEYDLIVQNGNIKSLMLRKVAIN